MFGILKNVYGAVQIFAPIPLEGTRRHKWLSKQERVIPIPYHLIDGSHVAAIPQNFKSSELQISINNYVRRFCMIYFINHSGHCSGFTLARGSCHQNKPLRPA